MRIPHDLVSVGHVRGAYGLKGWVRVMPYSAEANALLHAKTWWLNKLGVRDFSLMQSKQHGGDVVAQLMGVTDRDAAKALKGTTVQVERSHFPSLSDNEFYWIDLIGLTVENLQGKSLGTVSGLMDNGAHPILQVAEPVASDEKLQESLIPFVKQFVIKVAREAGKITVDWERDY